MPLDPATGFPVSPDARVFDKLAELERRIARGERGSRQPSYARAKLGTNQAIPTGTRTLIQLADFRFNTAGFTVASSRIVIPPGGDGLYSLNGAVNFAGNITGTRLGQIVVGVSGGDQVVSWEERLTNTANAGNTSALVLAATHYLAAGDTAALYCYHEAGVPLNVQTSAVLTGASGFPNHTDLTVARL